MPESEYKVRAMRQRYGLKMDLPSRPADTLGLKPEWGGEGVGQGVPGPQCIKACKDADAMMHSMQCRIACNAILR